MEPKIELYKDEKGNVIDTTDDKSMLGGLVSRFMESPTVLHQNTVKRTMSIIACDVVDKKSTGGMAFYLDESVITWVSQKQRSVALSSCEAKFMAATAASCQ
ncbi:secreted RxLR effector protein 161-like [Apium graveolens]|uniref:secreted RxLR effector protein 161-like n=1 Tax=Apium graveolens TaxID=4045 RepID=UPI003D7A01FD